MSISQRIAKRILPTAWFNRIRESSQRWMIQCSKCKSQRSIWSVGGIRFGAASVGKRVATHCSTCGRIVAARVYYLKPQGDNNERSELN